MDLIDAHHNLPNSNQLQAVPHLGQQAVLPVLQHQLDLLNCHLTITSLRIITEVFKEVELFVGVGISYTIWLQPNPTHQQRLLSILLPTTTMKISMIPSMAKISPSYRYRLFMCMFITWLVMWLNGNLINLLEILNSSFRKLNDTKSRFREVGADSDSH